MTYKINVRATKDSAIGLKHDGGPPMTKAGVLWPYDGYTCRLITDGAIERVSAQAATDKPPVVPATKAA